MISETRDKRRKGPCIDPLDCSEDAGCADKSKTNRNDRTWNDRNAKSWIGRAKLLLSWIGLRSELARSLSLPKTASAGFPGTLRLIRAADFETRKLLLFALDVGVHPVLQNRRERQTDKSRGDGAHRDDLEHTSIDVHGF